MTGETRKTNTCPTCGAHIHPPPEMCVCGHQINSHDNQGGRLKKAYCTVWEAPQPGAPWKQCTCDDATPTK